MLIECSYTYIPGQDRNQRPKRGEMQNAKDTFYEVLRNRVAAANAERTVIVRGAVRPGVVVPEHEVPNGTALRDCFLLHWTGLKVEAVPPARVAMSCEISYATAGSAAMGGVDRGRELAALDAELTTALHAAPQWAQKKAFAATASGAAPLPMASRIWWSGLAFGPTKQNVDLLQRTATLTVWSFQEEGER